MKTAWFALMLTTASLHLQVIASEEIVYSSEAYCVLHNAGVMPLYLHAYEKKLGHRPSAKECQKIREVVAEHQPDDWHYPEGKPYPGSDIRLSASQIALLEEAYAVIAERDKRL